MQESLDYCIIEPGVGNGNAAVLWREQRPALQPQVKPGGVQRDDPQGGGIALNRDRGRAKRRRPEGADPRHLCLTDRRAGCRATGGGCSAAHGLRHAAQAKHHQPAPKGGNRRGQEAGARHADRLGGCGRLHNSEAGLCADTEYMPLTRPRALAKREAAAGSKVGEGWN